MTHSLSKPLDLTYRWGEQRETCFKCKHFHLQMRENVRGEYAVYQCQLIPRKGRMGPYETCIKARDPGKLCGPLAERFEPSSKLPYKP